MRNWMIYTMLIVCNKQLNAQFFEDKNLIVSQTFQFYNEKSLNNKFNYSKAIAKGFQLEMVSKIKPVLSFNKGLGFGVNNNINETKTPSSGFNYFRAIAGLKLHLPFNENESKRLLNPFLLINYHFDYFFDKNIQFTLSNLNYGIGTFIQLKNQIGFVVKASHHQELGLEYRTFYSFNLGLIAGL